jgi:L-fuconolactonase
MTRQIDAHHHFWRYTPEEYGWIDEGMGRLRRDFLPPDLEQETRPSEIDGVVTVQARQNLEETDWLLGLAQQHALVSGVVGWLPLADENFPSLVERSSRTSELKGLRHILQDEPDDHYMLREDFNRGITALRNTQLVYDILIHERHLPQTIQFVDRHPQQPFVLDHMAKPRIREGVLEPWRQHMFELGKRGNVYCKVSGMATEANWQTWSQDDLRPYFDVVLEAFGPRRLMMGSDWPVCLLATTYERWLQTVKAMIDPLSPDEQALILGQTATEVYRLRR